MQQPSPTKHYFLPRSHQQQLCLEFIAIHGWHAAVYLIRLSLSSDYFQIWTQFRVLVGKLIMHVVPHTQSDEQPVTCSSLLVPLALLS
jgi:hypothetical protein